MAAGPIQEGAVPESEAEEESNSDASSSAGAGEKRALADVDTPAAAAGWRFRAYNSVLGDDAPATGRARDTTVRQRRVARLRRLAERCMRWMSRA